MWHASAVDQSGLASAYGALAELGRTGKFANSSSDSWNADQVLSHVVASSRLLAAATAEALAGRIPVIDFRATQSPCYLAAIAECASTRAGLAETVERTGQELVCLVSRLDDAQAAIAAPTIVLDGGAITVQRPVILSELLQPSHVLSHLDQLSALAQDDMEDEA